MRFSLFLNYSVFYWFIRIQILQVQKRMPEKNELGRKIRHQNTLDHLRKIFFLYFENQQIVVTYCEKIERIIQKKELHYIPNKERFQKFQELSQKLIKSRSNIRELNQPKIGENFKPQNSSEIGTALTNEVVRNQPALKISNPGIKVSKPSKSKLTNFFKKKLNHDSEK